MHVHVRLRGTRMRCMASGCKLNALACNLADFKDCQGASDMTLYGCISASACVPPTPSCTPSALIPPMKIRQPGTTATRPSRLFLGAGKRLLTRVTYGLVQLRKVQVLTT